MKLFVVVVSVAVVIMFVFGTDTAAAPTDYEDTNDMISLSAPVGGNSPYVYVSSADFGSSSKSSTKNPILELIKSVIKLLTKMFSYSDTSIPIGPGVRQHRGMLA
ncbi:uncharacterized protein LOC132943954 [Metopolophium dirhodum]|uniref:uncharacterized protein LOC132943954 n=1 Tax=Metopolophium dirhodum TaxID=44670 RepID=UPI00298FDA4C|nr:uncharacterized protein LOC132943954 [Metopolophium dirhodum]